MQELIVNIAPNLASKLPDFYKALGDTMLMVLWSGLISFVFGLLLGVVLTVTKPNGILENKVVYQILDKLVSLFRSIPFIILLTWVMPITRALVGTVLYVRGAIVPAGVRLSAVFHPSGRKCARRARRRPYRGGALDGLEPT